MSNPQRGEHVFALPSAPDDRLTLRYDLNALAALQQQVGGRLNEVLAQMQPEALLGQPALLRAALWAGLLRHHPQIDLQEVGRRIVDFEDIAAAVGAVLEALTRCLPEVKPKEVGQPAEDNPPPSATATTGAT